MQRDAEFTHNESEHECVLLFSLSISKVKIIRFVITILTARKSESNFNGAITHTINSTTKCIDLHFDLPVHGTSSF